VPTDPLKGSDFALSVAYRIVRGMLAPGNK